MKIQDESERYRESLSSAYLSLSVYLPDETPVGRVISEFREMISSYLTDADAFCRKDDRVNEYASLAYAHGWLDAGIYLGYFSGESPGLYLPEDICIPDSEHERLIEKSQRYERMLRDALHSVELAPESGSPFYQAAVVIAGKADDAYTMTVNRHPSQCTYASSLGSLSYGYGWLDAGLRAGLFRILANPELFTTETSRTL